MKLKKKYKVVSNYKSEATLSQKENIEIRRKLPVNK